MKTKVFTNQCKSCTKCVKFKDNDEIKKYCVWGKSNKLLTEPKGNEIKDCKLIGR
jgi:hypothetical protein